MKILAPLRDAAEVQPLLAAGADEFYCGLTPPGWEERFGNAWANRRNARSAARPGSTPAWAWTTRRSTRTAPTSKRTARSATC